jgi:outer membrane protein TolC
MRVDRLLGVGFVVATLAAGPAAAEQVQLPATEVLTARPYEPPPLAQPGITLDDAIVHALRHSPRVVRGAEHVRRAEGRYREARGLFDYTLRLAPAADIRLQEMTPSLLLRERIKRDAILGVRTSFLATGDAYRQILRGDLTTVPLCPDLLGRTGLGTSIDLDRADPTEVALSGVDRSVSAFNVDLGRGLGTSLITRICRAQPRTAFTSEAFVGIWRDTIRIIDFTGGRGLEGALLSASQVSRETFTLVEEIARTVAQRADIALDRLGPIARDELKRNAKLDASFTKTFRMGSTLRVDYHLEGQEHNYIGKPLDPAFGGLDIPHMFFSGVFGTLIQPLGRGRGATAAAATERAARAFLTGEREQLRHEASAAALRTVLAYLHLIAAQDRVRLFEESRARHAEILRLTTLRVTAGAIAQIEIERVRAHEATVLSALSQAQTDLLAARLSLADAMGVSVAAVEAAPTAIDQFKPEFTDVPNLDVLFKQAQQLRRDTRAAEARKASATALFEGARAAARPLLDLSITIGMSNLYESPFFRYLPDEQEAIIDARARVVTPSVTGTPVPPPEPVRYWDPRGYSRALTGRYEPFVLVGFTWELPFGNNRARGRVAQARAALSTATIDALNLDRSLYEGIVESKQTVDRAARAVAEWESAVGNSAKTFDSQQRLLESGVVTLIDVLLTEEALANTQQELLVRRQLYLSALGRLKFDLGELLTFDGAGTTSELVRFFSTGFTRR